MTRQSAPLIGTGLCEAASGLAPCPRSALCQQRMGSPKGSAWRTDSSRRGDGSASAPKVGPLRVPALWLRLGTAWAIPRPTGAQQSGQARLASSTSMMPTGLPELLGACLLLGWGPGLDNEICDIMQSPGDLEEPGESTAKQTP